MDLFGNVPRSPTERLENELIARGLPRARNMKLDRAPHRYTNDPLIDPKVRALYVAPDGETVGERDARLKRQRLERSQFRSRAKADAKFLHKRLGRALPVGLLYTEFYQTKRGEA